jgi:hypothetical protein
MKVVLTLAGLIFAAVTLAGEAAPPATSAVPVAVNSSATVKSGTPAGVLLSYGKDARGPDRTLTYTLVSGPKHGTVTLPGPHLKTKGPVNAVYTSARDYVGEDAFTWKMSDGAGDSNVAACSVTVTAATPVPESQTGCVAEDTATDIPAAFSGGGGQAYTIKTSNPAHGKLAVNGTTFRYTPEAHFTGADSFTWSMTYSKAGAAAPVSTGNATCWLVVKPAGMTDWPQWRADEWRSGCTTMTLPAALHLQWRRELPKTTSPFGGWYPDIDYCRPVQLGKTIFVPITASDCLAAFNTDTGELRWRFYASGAVRRPPAAAALPGGVNVVIFGSDDGWIYAVNAADGTVRWKFRGAPNNRKAMGFGRLSSVWPVWASPAVSGGKVYFAAGYLPAFGLYAYCLDAATGAVEWVNDGRITDMWNTSALGPLAVSFDGSKLFGSVEGSAVPWMLDSATGEFLGRLGVGHRYPGQARGGARGWYVDGKGMLLRTRGDYFEPEPMTITAGSQTFTAASAAALGVTGTVASLLAGDGKLFVTTAEGGLYCFAGAEAKPTIHPYAPTPLPNVTDEWATLVKAMLSRNDLKQGLALVWGVGSGRLVEELAKQSSLMVVAVDPDHKKLQALRAKMDAAGLSGARVSTLEGDPMEFGFAPYQAALVTSEDVNAAGLAAGQKMVEKLYSCTRPFGGEIWLPTSASQDAAIAGFAAASKNMPLSAVARQKVPGGPGEGFTQIKRTGFPEEKLWMKPSLGLLAFGAAPKWRPVYPAATQPSHWPQNGAIGGRDIYSWLPLGAGGPGVAPPPPPLAGTPGYPTPETLSTPRSIYTSMVNPLFGITERFSGLPSSGNDAACGGGGPWSNRYGDFGLSHGKISSIFDTSANYWGRLFPTAFGHCPDGLPAVCSFPWHGIVIFDNGPTPNCGCSPFMTHTDMALTPMDDEETWVCYQTVRTSNPFEEMPIKQIGVNFGALGDRYVPEEGILWTHHPYVGRCGGVSYNPEATTEVPPLVPVSYRGKVASVYRHSAQMEKTGPRYRGWVAASCVKGMTEITVPLAQPAVALRTASAPKVDGNLNDGCWDGKQRLAFVAKSLLAPRSGRHLSEAGTELHPQPDAFLPKIDDECFAMLRYDDANLYVAAGLQAGYGPGGKALFVTVTLNSRERIAPDVVLTCDGKGRQATGLDAGAWSGAAAAATSAGKVLFTAEMAIPWKVLAAAGLWKEQLAINVDVASNPLVGQYTPLYLDAPRGIVTQTRPHTVRLYFAEMEGKTPGQRVFDVSLQGKPALTKLDVVKEAGGPKRELMKEFKDVGIADKLIIGFAPQAGEPMLSGVEIVGSYAPADHAPNTPPSAKIEASTLSGPAPLEVTLDARKSQDPDGQIAQCTWDTGDGRLARGSILKHVFAEPGTYQVHLLVRDNRGGMAAESATVKVAPGDPAAFVCTVRAKDGDFATLSAWEAAVRSDLTGSAGKSLLFQTKARGSYAADDDGKPVTFAGGGTGTLRHVSGAGLAYVTGCQGTIQAGTVKCASGRTFETADAGHPIYLAVAEGHNDWPGGLTDSVKAAGGWGTDPTRCAVIRAAKGQGHAGRMKGAGGNFSGFALKGDLDATALPHLRVERLIVDPASTLTAGPGASVNRVLAGAVRLSEGALAANTVGTTLSAGNTRNIVNRSVSSYTVSLRDGRPDQPLPPKRIGSRTGFYNCTAGTFDSGNQIEVEFVNCLAAPGGKGFLDTFYSEPASTFRCVSTDGTAAVWDSGDGDEGNAVKQTVSFTDAPGGDYHLAAGDQGARGRGGPGLGPDIDGDERPGPKYDAGADSAAPAGTGK